MEVVVVELTVLELVTECEVLVVDLLVSVVVVVVEDDVLVTVIVVVLMIVVAVVRMIVVIEVVVDVSPKVNVLTTVWVVVCATGVALSKTSPSIKANATRAMTAKTRAFW